MSRLRSDHNAATGISRSPRRRRRALLLAVALAVVAVWAGALATVVGQTQQRSDAASTRVPEAVVETAPIPVAFQAPNRRVVLPAGAEQIDEYPTRFPHSPQGAAAAAVALTRYSASLDYVLVNAVLRLYAAPGAGAARAADSAAAIAVSAGRARLGLTMSGPAPADASVFAEPFAVRWVANGPDEVVVSVLSAVEYRSGQIQSRELVAATTAWQWIPDARDWRVDPGGAGTPPPTAEIGSTEFNDAGWSALAERRP